MTVYQILTYLSRANAVSRQIVLRANIILLGFDKLDNSQIAEKLAVGRHCVGKWRCRWQCSFDASLAIELNESRSALRRAVEDILSDAHRSGRPRQFA